MKSMKFKLDASAQKILKEVHTHFAAKDGGYPLDLSILIDEVFYEAFGYHVEDHLLPGLFKRYNLQWNMARRVLFVVKKKKKRDKK